MGGSKAGGMKTYLTNIARDPDFYKKIGSKGGGSPKRQGPRGFAADRELASRAGRMGGLISRKNRNKTV